MDDDQEQTPSLPQYGAPKPVAGIRHAGQAQKPLLKIIGRMLKAKVPSKSAIHISHGRRKKQPKFY